MTTSTLARSYYQPILTTPLTTAYPFVVDVVLSTSGEPDATIVGAEPVTFTVTFNRDMDTAVQPQVSFGPAEPYTDYTVSRRLDRRPHLGGHLQRSPRSPATATSSSVWPAPWPPTTPGWSPATTPGASASRSSPPAPRP